MMQKNPMPLKERERGKKKKRFGREKLRRKMEGGEAGLNRNGMEGLLVNVVT